VRVCIVHTGIIPPADYGGIERIVYWLAKDLARRGHAVTLLAAPGSSAPFATVLPLDRSRPIHRQVPADVDVVHWFTNPDGDTAAPHVNTVQGNLPANLAVDRNTNFVSRDHAARHGSSCWVHNGIDPDEYGPVDWSLRRGYVHFLGKAAWRVKNVRGAIDVARRAGRRLTVLGGTRLNFSMGFRLTIDPRVRFEGMVAGARKNALINGSAALVFPVRWHEPFGIAIIESLYFGCPVFATPYGSLPELVPESVGLLSTSASALAAGLREVDRFDPMACHEWVIQHFTARTMTDRYLALYGDVMNGKILNEKPPRLVEQVPKLLPWNQ
jgi:glycosyltransferase involved in cell wall biosynthesis